MSRLGFRHCSAAGLIATFALCCRTPQANAPAQPDGSSAPGAEPVRLITERTDQLTLPPKEQLSPDPGAEAALRRHIESVQRGVPNYEEMTPELAAGVRAQPGVREAIAQLGAIESVEFQGKGPQGMNLYDVTSANGVTFWRIALNSEGKISGLLVQPGPPPRPAQVPSEPELLAQLEAQLERATAADAFSGVVLIAKNGKPIFETARGLEDRERRIKNSMQTKFRLGSMNKMFTAVAILQLRDAGKLALDDTLAKWLPDYPNAQLASEVTLHHLLTHTGGTGDIFGPDYEANRTKLLTHQDYVNLYGKRNLEFKPGARFAYSNYGFVLLGRVIEKASGESYHDYVAKHVFEPAGMKATGMPLEQEPVPNRSVGYVRSPEGLRPNAGFLPPRATAAGGGLSTAGDMLRFATALQQHTLLSEPSTRLLMTGKVQMGPGQRYGYGFMERDTEDTHFFGHGGGAPGMNTDFKIFPESGHVLVVMANMDPPASGLIAEFITGRLPRRSGAAAAIAAGDAASGETRSAPALAGPPPSGPNLVENGDLAAGAALWSTMLWPPFETPKPLASRVENGALCATVRGGQNLIIGWPGDPSTPKGFALVEGKRYRFSFRASASGPLKLHVVAKVGHQEMPYTSAVQAPIPVEEKPQVFALDFEPALPDSKAGVAFVVSAPRGEAQNDICFDDVSVTGGAS